MRCIITLRLWNIVRTYWWSSQAAAPATLLLIAIDVQTTGESRCWSTAMEFPLLRFSRHSQIAHFNFSKMWKQCSCPPKLQNVALLFLLITRKPSFKMTYDTKWHVQHLAPAAGKHTALQTLWTFGEVRRWVFNERTDFRAPSRFPDIWCPIDARHRGVCLNTEEGNDPLTPAEVKEEGCVHV